MDRFTPPPDIFGHLGEAGEATDADLDAAITWAALRCGRDGFDPSGPRPALRALVDGDPSPMRTHDDADVISVAMRALNEAVRRRRRERNARLMPIAVLTIVGESCAAARALEGMRLHAADAPPLPLRECDKVECRCIIRQMSERTARKEGLL